jgi:hypothetical protein
MTALKPPTEPSGPVASFASHDCIVALAIACPRSSYCISTAEGPALTGTVDENGRVGEIDGERFSNSTALPDSFAAAPTS